MYIYKLTDINGLVYVGKTKNVDERLHTHKAKNWNTTSSRKLDFNGIKIEVMEECPEDISFERERYWINKFDSVNINKLNYNDLDSVIKIIKNEEKKIGTIQTEVAEETKKCMVNNKDWLNVKFWEK